MAAEALKNSGDKWEVFGSFVSAEMRQFEDQDKLTVVRLKWKITRLILDAGEEVEYLHLQNRQPSNVSEYDDTIQYDKDYAINEDYVQSDK